MEISERIKYDYVRLVRKCKIDEYNLEYCKLSFARYKRFREVDMETDACVR